MKVYLNVRTDVLVALKAADADGGDPDLKARLEAIDVKAVDLTKDVAMRCKLPTLL
jgi:hypothetical protein